MRLLLSSLTYPPHLNGQSIFTRNLAEGLAARGQEVMALIAGEPKQPRQQRHNGVQLVCLPALPLTFVHPDLRMPLISRHSIHQVFQQFQPHIVHVQDPSPLGQAVIGEAYRQNIPVLITHHTGPAVTAPYLRIQNPTLKRLVDGAAWKLVINYLNRANLVTVPSQYSAVMLASHGLRTDMQVIPCGVSLDDFQPHPDIDGAARRPQYGLDPHKTLFLYVGRLDIEKNLDVILQAMARVKRTDIQLALAGHGSEEARLKQIVDALRLHKQVHFLGQVAHASLPELLNTADVFVMPGNTESFSIATLEAMSCAKPVLAVNAAALPELITPGVNGYLFQPGQPEDAAQAIEKLADGKNQWPVMGMSSLMRAKAYSLPNMLHAYEQAYRLCRQKPTPSPLPRKSRANIQLASLAALDVGTAQNLLIVAPHPDDELLAAGGLMQKVLANGGRVAVVVVSNGDGQYLSPLIVDRRILPRQSDYIRLGQRRQSETLSALAKLGLNQDSVFFLGYPDGGLNKLWISNWVSTDPGVAPYTRATRSPYENTYNHGVVYLGSNLHQDLLTILKNFQPDIVIIPHPEDTHLDHSAVSNFAQLALAHYLAASVYEPPVALGYLVHYKKYPVPRGADMNKVLLPPAPLAKTGRGWLTYALSEQERLNKMEALHAYPSQMKIIGSYLRSFVRANEIFFELPVMERPDTDCEDEEPFEAGTALFEHACDPYFP